jgi:hypothetical protein
VADSVVKNDGTTPTITLDVAAMIRVMSVQAGALGVTSDAQLATAVNSRTDAQIAQFCRLLLIAGVHVSP